MPRRQDVTGVLGGDVRTGIGQARPGSGWGLTLIKDGIAVPRAGGRTATAARKEATLSHSDTTAEPTRRDFLLLTAGAFGVVGAAATVWPFIDQMNPDASTRALASVEVDISGIQPGQAITVLWRGKPVVIRNRTDKEVEEGKAVKLEDLKDSLARNANLDAAATATDDNRTAKGKENLLVMVKVCTHLGCIPLDEQGEYGGWFCPCHGSQYDTAGRIRKGPAPENLPVPVYAFLTDTTIRIG
jgi:ubiquinol-cytochrome c reductase iron-sulfur subunit